MGLKSKTCDLDKLNYKLKSVFYAAYFSKQDSSILEVAEIMQKLELKQALV